MSKGGRSEVCADCSAPGPHWASVNRAVLICDQCCSIHRSLGRHSSQVRHLTRTAWPATQLQMVQTLYNNGANSVWEHSIPEPSSAGGCKRKPGPHDKLHPNKGDFIRAKYQMLAFVHRPLCRDDDLSKQLHSSVRTGNLETCLRLLSFGAQANFFHPEKGTTPLHVAAKVGQTCQAELLAVYGADPGAPDADGNTPIDYARQAGHVDLADRLVEIQHELTDRLAFYLCGRKPDHKSGQHFIIPQLADSGQESADLAKAAKKKLQSLNNRLFEELAMDVYDEVDRRETDAVWLTTQNHSTLATEAPLVPFLPVNPEYSSTRNQGRQKLARFNSREFATLIIDILSDARRRQHGNSPKEDELIVKRASSRHASDSQDVEQPDYDSVASDEDVDVPSRKANRTKSQDLDASVSPVTARELHVVKNALAVSEAKVQQLMKANSALGEELRLMQKKFNHLQGENGSLRFRGPAFPLPPSQGRDLPYPSVLHSSVSQNHPSFITSNRSKSMFETSSVPKHFIYKRDDFQPLTAHVPKAHKQSTDVEGDYDNTDHNSELEDCGAVWKWEEPSDKRAGPDSLLPPTSDVIRQTEQITKNLQELLRAAQENQLQRPWESKDSIRKLRHSLGCLGPLMPWTEKPPSPMQTFGSRSSGTLGNPGTPSNPGDPASCFVPWAERIRMAVRGMVALCPERASPKSSGVSCKASSFDPRTPTDQQPLRRQVVQRTNNTTNSSP